MGSQTLSQRLTEGRLPVGEALRYAMMLAESLRKLHDTGQIHGAVSPASIFPGESGLELSPADPSDEITPYTAPEVVSGRPAEAVSDIFSYGAVLYEMLTGRVAFEGDTPAALAESIVNTQPESTGSPAADRLLASCLAKDPSSRCQRMQKVILELKLLGVAARKAEAVPRREMVEARQEKAAEALSTVQKQIAAFTEQLAAAHDRSARAEHEIQSLNEHIGASLVPNLESFAGRFESLEQSLTGIADRLSGLEQAEPLSALQNQVAAVSEQLAASHERSARAEQEIQSLNESIGSRLGPSLESFAGRLAQLEQTLTGISGRLDSLEQGLVTLSDQAVQANTETTERFTSVEGSVGSVRDRVIHVDELVAPMGARLQGVEAGVNSANQHAAGERDRMLADIQVLEAQLKEHAAAIESSRSAAAQTDDLVERVVEALESLQSSILEQPADEAQELN
jgi:predicted  nucleic acid-binding Zn-ribbon protein